MKTNLAKKTIKISAVVIFSVFVLIQIVFLEYASADTVVKFEKCDWSFAGECVVTTKDIEEGGKKITRKMEIPRSNEDEIDAEGRVTDKYTDSDGKEHYRTGTVNINEEVTFTNINDWKTSGEYEKELSNLNSPGGSFSEDSNKKGSTDGKKFIYTLLQSLPQEGEDLQKNVTLKEYLTWAFRFTLALAGFLAVMMIVIGGVEYIISGANESSRSDAKKRINSAISGLVLALVSYLVLYTINPSLVDFENNCFFKDCDKKTTSSESISNDGDNDPEISNGNSNVEINAFFPKNEGDSGTVKNTAESSYQKQDGDYSYNVERTEETIEYEDGSEKYRIFDKYTDNNKDNHFVITVKNTQQGDEIFSGEVVEYFDNDGNYEEMKFFKNGKEVNISEFSKL